MIDVMLPLKHWDMFAEGVWITMQLTVLSLGIGFLIALPCALLLYRKTGPLTWPVRAFVYVFRGTPLLVQAYLIYYGLAQFDFIRSGWSWPFLREAWWCALLAFSLNSAAYQTHILRGSFGLTTKGELDGAKSIGLNKPQIAGLILIPAALRRALPQLSNEAVFMLHSSVIASVITLQDILGAGRTLNAKYYVAYEGFLTAAILYLVLTAMIVGIFTLLQRRYLRHLNTEATKPNFVR